MLRPPEHGDPVGSVHLAPQTWSDGRRQNLYIRWEPFERVPGEVKRLVVYEHCIVVAGLGFGRESMDVEQPLGYRGHQWQKAGFGVVGRSSAAGVRKQESAEEGLVWARHCEQEVANWGVFLPTLYRLYQVVENPAYNPFADLTVEGRGDGLGYRYVGRARQ